MDALSFDDLYQRALECHEAKRDAGIGSPRYTALAERSAGYATILRQHFEHGQRMRRAQSLGGRQNAVSLDESARFSALADDYCKRHPSASVSEVARFVWRQGRCRWAIRTIRRHLRR